MAFVITITFLLILLTASCAMLWKNQTRPEDEPQGYIVIPCTAGTPELALTVRSAYWGEMLESPGRRRTILIVLIDAGSNGFLARRLASELRGVETVDISALSDRIRRQEAENKGKNYAGK